MPPAQMLQKWRVVHEKKEKANRIVPNYVDGNHAYFSNGYTSQFCPEENCQIKKDHIKLFDV